MSFSNATLCAVTGFSLCLFASALSAAPNGGNRLDAAERAAENRSPAQAETQQTLPQDGEPASVAQDSAGQLYIPDGTVQKQVSLKGGVNTQFGWGIGDDFLRAAINYETVPVWSFEIDYIGRFDLSFEIGVSYWRATSGGHKHDELAQVTVLPLLRWWIWGPFYMEGGAGPSYFSDTMFIEKDISTRFQFADQVGFGVRVSDSMRVSARFAHFSNAGIRRPNPGLNVCFISIAYDF